MHHWSYCKPHTINDFYNHNDIYYNKVNCGHIMLWCSQPQVGDVFIGYHADTAASLVLQVCQSIDVIDDLPDEQVNCQLFALSLAVFCNFSFAVTSL